MKKAVSNGVVVFVHYWNLRLEVLSGRKSLTYFEHISWKFYRFVVLMYGSISFELAQFSLFTSFISKKSLISLFVSFISKKPHFDFQDNIITLWFSITLFLNLNVILTRLRHFYLLFSFLCIALSIGNYTLKPLTVNNWFYDVQIKSMSRK